MAGPKSSRLLHIKENIAHVRRLLGGRTIEVLLTETDTRAAIERYLAIISEASRSVPPDLAALLGPSVPWGEIAAIGNILRHEYDRLDIEILWSIYENDLGPLDEAIDKILEAMARESRGQ